MLRLALDKAEAHAKTAHEDTLDLIQLIIEWRYNDCRELSLLKIFCA